MKLADLFHELHIEVYAHGHNTPITQRQVFAGDRISDLLQHSSEGTLLITNLLGSHLLRLVELVDVSAICLLNRQPTPVELLPSAEKNRTWIVVSPLGLFETCGRIYEVLQREEQIS
ncbi:MAG: hypothetical protein HJJLKODD_00385 [Phycisphaerae bacterium]|nr:hypothetical protein [Phycisphaerae bacterium]